MEYHSNAYKVTMIFAMKYQAGRPNLASVWNAMTTELREMTTELREVVSKLESGFTEIRARGEWRGEGDDDSRLYFITVPTLEGVEELRNFVKKWRTPFGQTTMYFDYHPVDFELVVD